MMKFGPETPAGYKVTNLSFWDDMTKNQHMLPNISESIGTVFTKFFSYGRHMC